jgi:hypothetical protein
MHLVVTVTFNALRDGVLAPFLGCIRTQTAPDVVLLAIDNASTDGTANYLREIDMPNLRLILNRENVGFARACNQGIALARTLGARYVTFLNNDTEFTPNLLANMTASLEATGAAGLSPLVTYYNEPDRIWFATGSFRWSRGMIPYHDRVNQSRKILPIQRILDTAFVSGCCFLLRLDTLEGIDGFDERFFVYWEDADLCRDLGKRGRRFVTDTGLECRHKVSISTGGAFSDFSIFHLTRGHVMFVRKHFGLAALGFVLPIVALKTMLNVVRRRIRLCQLPVWCRAIGSGLRG